MTLTAELPMTAKADNRAQLRDFKRRQILDAAKRIFAERGLDAATMREIAAAAGCTTGAIYPLFPAKEEIYAALLRESLDQLEQAVQAAIAESSNDGERLKSGATAWFGYYAERPAEVALGLYLFRGAQNAVLAPHGLSREIDRGLNDQLARSLAPLSESLGRLGGLSPALAAVETASLFAHLLGLLMAHHTGRLKPLGQSASPLLAHHLDALIARLQWE